MKKFFTFENIHRALTILLLVSGIVVFWLFGGQWILTQADKKECFEIHQGTIFETVGLTSYCGITYMGSSYLVPLSTIRDNKARP